MPTMPIERRRSMGGTSPAAVFQIALMLLTLPGWLPGAAHADIFVTRGQDGVPLLSDRPPYPGAVPFLRTAGVTAKTAAAAAGSRDAFPISGERESGPAGPGGSVSDEPYRQPDFTQSFRLSD